MASGAPGAPGGGGYPSTRPIHVQPENIQFILNRNAQVIREWAELNNMKAGGQVTAELEQRIHFLYQTLSESLQMLAAVAEARGSPAVIPSERILAGLPQELISEELRALCMQNIHTEREMAKQQQEQQRQQQMMMMQQQQRQQQQALPPHGAHYQSHGPLGYAQEPPASAMGRHFPHGGPPSSHGQQAPKMEHPSMPARSGPQQHQAAVYSQRSNQGQYHGGAPVPAGAHGGTRAGEMPSYPPGIDMQQQQQYGVSQQSQMHQHMDIPTSAAPQMHFDPYGGRGGNEDTQRRMGHPPPSSRGMMPPDNMPPGSFGGGGGYQFFE